MVNLDQLFPPDKGVSPPSKTYCVVLSEEGKECKRTGVGGKTILGHYVCEECFEIIRVP